MKIFSTQEQFLREYPITYGIINLRHNFVQLEFHLHIPGIDIVNALDVSYYAICFAYHTFVCASIKSERLNARHFSLDGEVIITEKSN